MKNEHLAAFERALGLFVGIFHPLIRLSIISVAEGG